MAKEQMTDIHGKVTTTVNSSGEQQQHTAESEILVMPAEDKNLDNHNNNNTTYNNDDIVTDQENRAKEILEKFHKILSNEEGLNNAAEHLLNDLVDDTVFGVLLEIHQLAKTGNLIAIEGIPENPEYPNTIANDKTNSITGGSSTSTSTTTNSITTTTTSGNSIGNTSPPTLSHSRGSHASSNTIDTKCTLNQGPSKNVLKVDKPNHDIFGVKIAKKPMDCTCPNCDRLVSAARFAPHLEKCMGMGRLSSRIASRRLATKETYHSNHNNHNIHNSGNVSTPEYFPPINTTFTKNYLHSHNTNNAIATDEDDDDVDWSTTTEKRRKKTHANSRNNAPKKNYSNPKF